MNLDSQNVGMCITVCNLTSFRPHVPLRLSGNGIQQAFYQDPNVLYISVHVHQDGKFYPAGNYGNYEHCGGSAGLGKLVTRSLCAGQSAELPRNLNIPWSKQGMGDADYIYAFQQIVMPVANEFDPDLVISKNHHYLSLTAA